VFGLCLCLCFAIIFVRGPVGIPVRTLDPIRNLDPIRTLDPIRNLHPNPPARLILFPARSGRKLETQKGASRPEQGPSVHLKPAETGGAATVKGSGKGKIQWAQPARIE
jgi:hypothetical protein